MSRLSAIVITKNEAANIAACLAGVAFCDERIVVDSGSSGRHREDRQDNGAHVIDACLARLWAAKEFCPVAGDRRLGSVGRCRRAGQPGACAREIKAAIAAPQGRCLRNSAGDELSWPRHAAGWRIADYVLRLFRRGAARFTDDLVHERVVCDGHGRAADRRRCSIIRWRGWRMRSRASTVIRPRAPQMLVASGRRVSFMSGIGHGLWTFIRVYLLKLGFLDGREGFLQAVANAEGSYYRYMKAWHLSRQP